MDKFQEFIGSSSFDSRLAPYDIIGSIAHVKMLVHSGIISGAEGKKIVNGLESILKDIKKGNKISVAEDIHYSVEKELIKRIGSVGGKMHTARSRNDQVALDLRLYLKDEAAGIIELIENVQISILNQAQANIKFVMPGYTHLQPAQPVLFSHYLLSYAWMFERDKSRINNCQERVNILPLGSAALAGTSFPIDRKYTAKLLGFKEVSENSIDAVSDRDFAIEFISVLSIIAVHLSRLAEELVIFSSVEFDFWELSDKFTSGSSIMPQKKNPDSAEIIRGKTGRIFGDLFAILTIMKGLPLSYNRDMQEDKPPLFDAVDTTRINLEIMAEIISTLKIKSEQMKKSNEKGFLGATEIADYLAKCGVPFRQAHEIVKQMVLFCQTKGKTLKDLSIEEYKSFSKYFNIGIYDKILPKKIINEKKSYGGTSRDSVSLQIEKLKKLVKK
ncbi:MAG: argininosuccinate lyase [Elusimicrobia bacterium]|nr:argininosuccinate lyase [Elusimicrobiota bacterium]